MSLMDNVFDSESKKEENIEELPSDYIEPIKEIGDYKRKYQFESVIYSLSNKQRLEIEALVTKNQRNTFQEIASRYNTQKEYFQFFDSEYDLLLKKKAEEDKKYGPMIDSISEKVKEFEKNALLTLENYNIFLMNMKYLTKELQPEEIKTFINSLMNFYIEDIKNKTFDKINEMKKKMEERMIITHYLFFETYDTFFRDKPLE